MDIASGSTTTFRATLLAEAQAAGAEPHARLIAFGRGYIRFARTSPGLFLLMFRSERLDWSEGALAQAGTAAFALLTEAEAGDSQGRGFENLVLAISRLSLMHGLATLLIDGRLAPMTARVEGADLDTLIEQVIEGLSSQG